MSKYLKIAKKAVQWILGLLNIFLGILMGSTGDELSGLLFVLAGIILIPPVTGRIPRFRFRKTLLVVASVILFVTGAAFLSDADVSETSVSVTDEVKEAEKKENTDNSSENNDNNSDNKATKQKKVKKEQKNTEVKKPAKVESNVKIPDKKKLAGFMKKAITDEGIEYSDSDIKKWREYPEETFLPVFKEIVSENIAAKPDIEDAFFYIDHAKSLYMEIYTDSTLISDITKMLYDIKNSREAIRTTEKKYDGTDLEAAYSTNNTRNFYVAQRLEKEYSDSIIGDIEKRYDGYTQKGSYWVAYDVDNSFGTPIPSGNRYVLYSENLNEFSKTGSYSISYYDTGNTVEVKDSGGFVSSVPVYQMIKDKEALISDFQIYNENKSEIDSLYQRLIYNFEKDKYSSVKCDGTAIDPGNVSGQYISKDGTRYEISMYSARESECYGIVEIYSNNSSQYTRYRLYEDGTNRFLAAGTDSRFVIGFSANGEKITMHIYEHGKFKESIIINQHYYS